MRPAPRSAPRRPLPVAVVLLLAALLAFVPTWPESALAGLSARAQAPVSATQPLPDGDFHAEDGCATACAAQFRPRHDHTGERLAPADHFATLTRTAVATGTSRERTQERPPGTVPVSPGRASHDRGRAPPASNGI
ncbi:hypothetical protein [Streptomyces sp. SID8352]|uniref:hypothetical protein n=1 Tax=unclassified Streptomyces TaxID=2593676 RepID=UPI00136CB3A7|nr:hypothetical protein [Streptomyces sp. SID8352]MYU26000.1 hypothetical protein [Streptomyces sp. SID8352]